MSVQPTTNPGRPARIPDEYLRSPLAPAPRTLVDVLRSAADKHPDAPAIDDGAVTLSYAELAEEIIAAPTA